MNSIVQNLNYRSGKPSNLQTSDLKMFANISQCCRVYRAASLKNILPLKILNVNITWLLRDLCDLVIYLSKCRL